MKKIKIPVIVSLLSLLFALASYFLPFISIENYKSVSGIKLLLTLYGRFEIQKASTDAMENLLFHSTSLPALLTFLVFIAAVIMMAFYLRKENVRFLNYSIIGTILGFILYGVQLGSSSSFVSDFFGMLTQYVREDDGSIHYTVPDIQGVTTGMGARLLVIFSLLALCAVLIAKYHQHEAVDRSGSLETPFSIAYRQFKRNKLAILGVFVISGFTVVCFYGPVFSHYALLETSIEIAKEKPSLAYPFGTDSAGRDILSRLLYGGRISLEVGVVTVLIEIVIGTVIGGIAGFYGGWVDNVLMRVDDIFLSLPFLPVVIIIGAVMMDLQVDPAKRIYFVMLILGLLFWPTLARLVRGQILSLREQEFMLAAKALGIKDRHRIFRHLIPNTLPNIIVTATLDVGTAILTESALSFLGLGVAMPFPSWGNIVNAVNDPNDFALRPWLWIPAGVCILLTVLAINLAGDGLRDAFDPKMKR